MPPRYRRGVNLDLTQQLEAITIEGNRFWDAIEAAADLQARVPSCPDWDIDDLARHLLGVHAGWTDLVEHPSDDPTQAFGTSVPGADLASDKAALVPLGRETLHRMVDVFGVGRPAATDMDLGRATGRRVHHAPPSARGGGASVGRADRERRIRRSDRTRGRGRFDRRVPHARPARVARKVPLRCLGSVHLHCTDVDGEWFVHPDGRVEPIHAKGDVALRGGASDLLLAVYGRVPLDQLDVIGDRAVAQAFLSVHFG